MKVVQKWWKVLRIGPYEISIMKWVKTRCLCGYTNEKCDKYCDVSSNKFPCGCHNN